MTRTGIPRLEKGFLKGGRGGGVTCEGHKILRASLWPRLVEKSAERGKVASLQGVYIKRVRGGRLMRAELRYSRGKKGKLEEDFEKSFVVGDGR